MFDYILIPIARAGIIDDAIPLSVVVLNMVDFLLTIVGVIGIISILVSGIMYLLAQGDSNLAQKAKKAMMWSIVAMVMIMGSMVIVNALVSFIN